MKTLLLLPEGEIKNALENKYHCVNWLASMLVLAMGTADIPGHHVKFKYKEGSGPSFVVQIL